ncbi:ABC transporter permease [Pontibacillus litoralis]|uniref:Multidrug ABC transporter permease n=1 Tax=Pontibacillus litoralis JSM 072002 TaxID=1385512 RepID=A0A0A5HSJ7_9BACI|nr:ABC transporter permease [Pontibacillus litoralis]KGX86602.1 multidrug ABC transporter permease [Pontibacillus litoralis JSM 072002]
MRAILRIKCTQFMRHPWTFLIFTAMAIGFALMIGGTGGNSSITVPITITDDSIRSTSIIESLQQSTAFEFKEMDQEEMEQVIEKHKAEVGVQLNEDNFQLIVGVNSFNTQLVESTIRQAYMNHSQQQNILNAANITNEEQAEALLNNMNQAVNQPIFTIDYNNFQNTETKQYNSTFQGLFGYSLFFIIYTICYNVLPILLDKKDGIWDRMILSPVKKWEMYTANLIFSFFQGYIQTVLIFSIFKFIFKVDFHEKFMSTLTLLIPYVFTIVALAIFITATVRTVQQFNAVVPIVAVSMAMIGGAFWPLEIVESPLLITLSKINPLTYGMEILKGAVLYNYSFEQLLYPISILLLMGVVMMGIGIHFMERRHI